MQNHGPFHQSFLEVRYPSQLGQHTVSKLLCQNNLTDRSMSLYLEAGFGKPTWRLTLGMHCARWPLLLRLDVAQRQKDGGPISHYRDEPWYN